MKASTLLNKLTKMISKHGDLEIVFDCDAVLNTPGSVIFLDGPYLETPLFVILPYATHSNSSNGVDPTSWP